LANVTKPKPLEPRSLKMISTSRIRPNLLNMARRSGSRNRNGMLETWRRFGVTTCDAGVTPSCWPWSQVSTYTWIRFWCYLLKCNVVKSWIQDTKWIVWTNLTQLMYFDSGAWLL
jgi:hypothetical protein